MNTFVCRDVRLHGWRPQGDVLEVNFNTPLKWLVDNIATRGKASGGDLLVKIMCHGLPGFLQCCRGTTPHPTAGNGLTTADFPVLKALKGRVRKIELHSCLVARIGPCFETTSLGHTVAYDGNLFCFKLAQITGAEVKASIHVQWYWSGTGPSNGVNFGHWNGRVFTWNPGGKIIKTEDFPYTEMIP